MARRAPAAGRPGEPDAVESDPEREDSPIRVGIGLIERDGLYLIRRRPDRPGSPMPGYWEFPGGKCEPDEPIEECVRRECLEEVGVPIRVVGLRKVVRHRYRHGHVELWFFDARLDEPRGEPATGSGFLWARVEDLPSYTFPGANETIVADLIREARETRRPRA